MSKWIPSSNESVWRTPLAIVAACLLTAVIVHESSERAKPGELRSVVAGVERRMLGSVLERAGNDEASVTAEHGVDEVCTMSAAGDPIPGG
jgi:hypothetical protein